MPSISKSMHANKNMDGYANNFTFVKTQEFLVTKSASSAFLMWRLTINCLYYFGVTPFKFEFSEDIGKLYLKTSSFHQIRSLLQAWIPFSINEMNYTLSEVREHFAIEKPNAKAYLDLFYKFLIKFNYVLLFRTLFCRKSSLTYMLNHILETCLALERYSTKPSRRFTKYIPYFITGVILLTRIGMNIMWCAKDFIPDQNASEKFPEKFYKVFIQRFRSRFHMDVSATFSYTSLDYFIGIYEVWLMNISRVMWLSFDTLISAVIPLTFSITINKLHEETVQRFSVEDGNQAVTVCHLFDNLKNMSNLINSNWGMICLIWVFYQTTRHSFNVILWSFTGDPVEAVFSATYLISLFLVLYLSGNAYCSITRFKDRLTDQLNWSRFKSDAERSDLQRILVQLDECCVGIGKTGLYRLNYSFAAQMYVLSITLFVINFDSK